MKRFLLLFFIICAVPALLKSQSADELPGDYEQFPRLDYVFNNLQLNLEVNPDARTFAGTATYTITPKTTAAEELILDSRELSVKSVMVAGSEAEFEIEAGKLIIDIPENRRTGSREFEVKIEYETTPEFGVLKTPEGTLFTSTLPFARSHWVPVFDHPRVTFSYVARIMVPEGKTAVSNGFLESESSAENGNKVFNWKSAQKISATDLGIVVGRLSYEEIISGIKPVRVYREDEIISRERKNELTRAASRKLGEVQRQYRMEFPYDGLSLIVLPDHFWETKPYLAGMGYLFTNKGSLENQLNSVVEAQWVGVWQRPEQWSDAAGTVLMQNLIRAERQNEKPNILDFPETSVYPWFNPLKYEKWNGMMAEMNASDKRVIRETVQPLLYRGQGVYGWQDFAKIWYEESGRYKSSVPEFTETEEKPEPVMFDLVFERNSENNRIEVILEPRDEIRNEKLEIPLIIFQAGDQRTETVEILKTGGSQNLDVGSGVQNITVDYDKLDGVDFFEMKDLSFWLHQIRRDPSPERRERAALAMPRFRDDPDIQLALSDYLRQEESTNVRTAMIRALSDIVEGASGTDQVFLTMSRNASGEELVAVVDAFWYYEGNSQVIEVLSRIALSNRNPEAAVTAISVYRHVAGMDRFNELARRILLGSQSPQVKAGLIRELFRSDQMNVAVNTSLDVLEGNFPYAMRAEAFNMLVTHDRKRELRSVMTKLSTDNDPRIRYLVLQHADVLEPNQMNDLLEKRYFSEFDQRVRVIFEDF